MPVNCIFNWVYESSKICGFPIHSSRFFPRLRKSPQQGFRIFFFLHRLTKGISPRHFVKGNNRWEQKSIKTSLPLFYDRHHISVGVHWLSRRNYVCSQKYWPWFCRRKMISVRHWFSTWFINEIGIIYSDWWRVGDKKVVVLSSVRILSFSGPYGSYLSCHGSPRITRKITLEFPKS